MDAKDALARVKARMSTRRFDLKLDGRAVEKLKRALTADPTYSYGQIVSQLVINAPVDKQGRFIGLFDSSQPRQETQVTKYVADSSGALHEVNPDGRSVKVRPLQD
jgi:hypothetical protein